MELTAVAAILLSTIIALWIAYKIGITDGKNEIDLETHRAYQKALKENELAHEKVSQQLEYYRSRLYRDSDGRFVLRDATNDLSTSLPEETRVSPTIDDEV
ncbi:MAG: hypothetical protein AB7P94_17315 [Steroidobacteraceae bacterium]